MMESHAAHHALSVLVAESPEVSITTAATLAERHYGIRGEFSRLTGEKDANFLIDSGAIRYVLKVVHPDEPAVVTDLATEAMIWLSQDDHLPAQPVIRTLDGLTHVRCHVDGVERTLRMAVFLEGQILRSVPSTPQLRENLGETLARMGLGFRAFHHPASDREMLWDIRRAAGLRPLLAELAHLPDHALITECFDRFDRSVAPALASLRSQIVHNDMSVDNIVIGGDNVTVTGIIDFGDVVQTQLINDVAVAATSQLADGEDPMAPVLDFVRGYNATVRLETDELRLLYDLVRTRTAMRIVISEWRAARFPENRAYIMRNTPRSWEHLKQMPATDAETMFERLTAACATSQEINR